MLDRCRLKIYPEPPFDVLTCREAETAGAIRACAFDNNGACQLCGEFQYGSDDGDWHLTDNPDRLLQIEANGGNPAAYLHGQVFTPVPVWYVPLGTSPTHFLGNYYAQQVGRISFDLNIFSGTQAPNRAITFGLLTTLDTGDFSQGLEAYKIGANVSTLPVGWETVLFLVRSYFDFHSAGLGRSAR